MLEYGSVPVSEIGGVEEKRCLKIKVTLQDKHGYALVLDPAAFSMALSEAMFLREAIN